MALLKNIAFVFGILFLTQCATTSPGGNPTDSGPSARVGTGGQSGSDNSTLSSGCPLDKLQWLYSSNQFDSAKQKEIAAKIMQAAQADAATLDQLVANNNNNPLAISSTLKTYVEKMAQSRVPVSDEFYKQYINSRLTMCAVIDALRSGSIKQDESSKVAGNTFRDIAQSFEKLKN